MKKNIVKVVVLVLILSLGWVIYKTCIYKKPSVIEKPAPEIHIAMAEAPDFSLESLSGEQVSLSSLKGKGVILFFWTTWCPHCRSVLSKLTKEYEDIKASNIELLAIDINESKARVESFKKQNSINFPILLDSDGEVAGGYGVAGIPTVILISKETEVISSSHDLPPEYKELLK